MIEVVALAPTGSPTDSDVDDWCTLFAAGHRAESGGDVDGGRLRAEVGAGRASGEAGSAVGTGPEDADRRWLARLDRAPAGIAAVHPRKGFGFLRLYVPPARRRLGVGTALLDAVRVTFADIPLRSVTSAGEAGQAFAARHGARTLLRLVELTQPLGEVRHPTPPPRLPPPYRVEIWQDAVPDDLLASYARAKTAVGDAPGASWQVDADWTPDRVRAWERARRAEGRQVWMAAVVADGEVVAFTEITTDSGTVASQHDTAVVRGHRRRGLGTGVKVALADHLHRLRPDVTEVRSTVNATNRPMIAVNVRLGYRVSGSRLLVELPAG